MNDADGELVSPKARESGYEESGGGAEVRIKCLNWDFCD